MNALTNRYSILDGVPDDAKAHMEQMLKGIPEAHVITFFELLEMRFMEHSVIKSVAPDESLEKLSGRTAELRDLKDSIMSARTDEEVAPPETPYTDDD